MSILLMFVSLDLLLIKQGSCLNGVFLFFLKYR